MRKTSMLAALLCACLPLGAAAISADELIAKNIEARGGASALAALKTVRYTGTFKPGGGIEFGFTQIVKRGGVRNELAVQGLVIVQAYDGKEGWAINPLQGRKDPERMPADDIKSLVDQADLDGPLIDYKAKGNKVEYLGTEDVDGSDAHKLRVTQANGDKRIVFLDPDYFLTIREITQRQVRGREVESEVDFGAYEKVDGVYVPFEIAAGPRGATEKGTLVIDKAEPNVTADDALFRFPAK
jgi:outer membrane lipoprotein-sorting protein